MDLGPSSRMRDLDRTGSGRSKNSGLPLRERERREGRDLDRSTTLSSDSSRHGEGVGLCVTVRVVHLMRARRWSVDLPRAMMAVHDHEGLRACTECPRLDRD